MGLMEFLLSLIAAGLIIVAASFLAYLGSAAATELVAKIKEIYVQKASVI